MLAALVLLQPLAADIRSAQVLGRDDTRQQARDWIEAQHPPELRVSVEPAVPGRWFRSNPEGDPPTLAVALRAARRLDRAGLVVRRRADGARVCAQYKPGLVARPDGGVRASAYHAVLDPGVIDDYRLYGYCLVMTVDVVRDRALQTGDRDARAYYARLDRESRVVAHLQPVRRGRRARALQLRPLLQLLPARVRPAGADGRASTGSTTASRPPGRRSSGSRVRGSPRRSAL